MEIDFDFLDNRVNSAPEHEFATGADLGEALGQENHFKIKLTEPQTRFIKLECSNPLFVGGYGSGKTTIKLVSSVNDLTQFPGANIGLYEPTFDLITLNTAPRLEEMLTSLDLPYQYDKSKQIINVEVASGVFGKFIMRSMNNPSRIVGYEVFRSHVDEIGVVHPANVEDVWNKIVARNRQKVYALDEQNRKVIDIKTKEPLLEQNRISAYGTPDDGYGFTYQMWGKDPAEGYEYVRAPTSSNAENIPKDYIDNLYKIYPASLVDAFLEGHWTNFTTGTVYYAFDRNEQNTKYEIATREQLHIGMDFNVYNMHASVGVVRKGILYLLDEFCGLRDTPDMIDHIKARYPNHNVIVYPDASGKNASSKSSTLSDHKLLRDAGFKLKVRPSNPHVRDRVLSVNAAFEQKKVLVNTETCPETTSSLEKQTYGKDGMPDKTAGYDHLNDAAGYLINYLYGIKRPRIEFRGVRNI